LTGFFGLPESQLY